MVWYSNYYHAKPCNESCQWGHPPPHPTHRSQDRSAVRCHWNILLCCPVAFTLSCYQISTWHFFPLSTRVVSQFRTISQSVRGSLLKTACWTSMDLLVLLSLFNFGRKWGHVPFHTMSCAHSLSHRWGMLGYESNHVNPYTEHLCDLKAEDKYHDYDHELSLMLTEFARKICDILTF